MERSEKQYSEFKEKVQSLVDFMQKAGISSTKLNIEFVSNFTMCNVECGEGDDKKEFSYVFDNSDINDGNEDNDKPFNISENKEKDENKTNIGANEIINEDKDESSDKKDSLATYNDEPSDKDKDKPKRKNKIDYNEEQDFQKKKIGEILKNRKIL